MRPGGTVIEPGTFVDMGDVPVNPTRDIVHARASRSSGSAARRCPSTRPRCGCSTATASRLPLARLVSHRVGLEGVGDALELAQSPDAVKVLVSPAR